MTPGRGGRSRRGHGEAGRPAGGPRREHGRSGRPRDDRSGGRGFGGRPTQGRQIEGINAVTEALRANRRLEYVLLSEERRGREAAELERLAAAAGVTVRRVPSREIDSLAVTAAPQGVLARGAPLEPGDLAALEHDTAEATATGPTLLLALDGITDPQNFGSLIRTAEVLGLSGLIFPGRRTAGLGPATLKAAAGAAEHVGLYQVPNLVEALKRLQRAGVWVYGADAAGDATYWEADLTLPCALVLGAEGRGLSRLTREHCDLLLRIPVLGRIDSLNAAVAGAVIAAEARRQRAVSRPRE